MRGDKEGDFIVYRYDHDEDEEDEHYRIDCGDPVVAAELAAERMTRRRDTWEWDWPSDFVVTNDRTGARILVTVEREESYSYSARYRTVELPPRPTKEPEPEKKETMHEG